MNIIQKIQIYGDSIMKGILLDGNKRYIAPKNTPVTSFQQEFDCDINNKSKFGCTIGKGMRLLERDLERGLSCDTVLLEYGGNDCDFNWEQVAQAPQQEHLPNTPPKEFERTYRKMLRLLQEHAIRPIVMSLPPIDAGRYLNWITRNGLSRENILKWLGDVQMIYRFQELYSNIATRVAYQMKCMFVDVRSAFLEKHDFTQLLCEDGIHPNEKGHALIKDVFARYAAHFVGKTNKALA